MKGKVYSPPTYTNGCQSWNTLKERKKVIKPQQTVDEYGNTVIKDLIVRDERN